MTKRKPVSIDEAVIKELIDNAKEWGLVSLQTQSRMEREGAKPSKAECVNSALLLFIKAKRRGSGRE